MQPNYKAQHDAEHWSETRFLSLWSPESEVGLFLHVGRLRGHLDWWWSQTAVYLPDGTCAIDKQWGRDTEPNGHRNGNFSWISTEPDKAMELAFDGVCEVATPEEQAAGPVGAGAPSLPVKFDIKAKAWTPRWDMHASIDKGPDWAGGSHTEQTFEISGTLTAGDQTYELQGHCVDDHSSGERQFSAFGGDDFLLVAMPNGSFHSVDIRGADDERQLYVGVAVKGEELVPLTDAKIPDLTDLLMRDKEFEIVISQEGGQDVPLQAEILGYFVFTITDENDNINGCHWDDDGDPILFIETPIKLTLPNGAVAYGHMERSTRQHNVDRETYEIKLGSGVSA